MQPGLKTNLVGQETILDRSTRSFKRDGGGGGGGLINFVMVILSIDFKLIPACFFAVDRQKFTDIYLFFCKLFLQCIFPNGFNWV